MVNNESQQKFFKEAQGSLHTEQKMKSPGNISGLLNKPSSLHIGDKSMLALDSYIFMHSHELAFA